MKQEELSLDEYHAQSNALGRARSGNMTMEQRIVSSILRYLDLLPNVYAIRVNSGRVRTEAGRLVQLAPPGSSDIGGFLSVTTSIGKLAIVMAIEVKTKDGKVTDLQQAYLDGVQQAGGFALVARSVAEVQQRLEAFIKQMEAM